MFGEGEAFVGDMFAMLGHLFAMKVHLDFVCAIIGAGREVGEFLKGEKLVRCVVVLEDAVVSGFKNGVMDFFLEIGFFAGRN